MKSERGVVRGGELLPLYNELKLEATPDNGSQNDLKFCFFGHISTWYATPERF